MPISKLFHADEELELILSYFLLLPPWDFTKNWGIGEEIIGIRRVYCAVTRIMLGMRHSGWNMIKVNKLVNIVSFSREVPILKPLTWQTRVNVSKPISLWDSDASLNCEPSRSHRNRRPSRWNDSRWPLPTFKEQKVLDSLWVLVRQAVRFGRASTRDGTPQKQQESLYPIGDLAF